MGRKMDELVWCAVPGCQRQMRAKTFCDSHLRRFNRGFRTPDKFKPFPAKAECGIDKCDRPLASRGLCRAHYETARRFNISLDELNGIFENGCGICGAMEDIHVDHDHSCCAYDGSCGMCIRGGLCSNCNLGLGALGDSLAKIMLAVAYLRDSKTRILDKKRIN